MKLNLSLTCLAALMMAVPSYATVTLQFSTASAKLTNIQNAAGNAAGGLRWGIVIDTAGNGFDSNGTNYDGFTFPSSGTGTFLANGVTATATDDFFYWGGGTTLATISGTDSGTNAISSISSVPFGTNGISAGDPFALIWFDAATTNDGDKYGFLVISGGADPFVIPSDGSTTSYSPNFAGTDPVRLASNTLGVAGPVPEPSRVLLLGFGALSLVFRRRRS